MHLLISDKEREYIDTNKFGWNIKKGCPPEIRKSIERKKKILDNQMGEITNGNSRH